MTRPAVPVHYLRPNEAERTPACVLFLDTETRVIAGTEPEVLGLRLWVLRRVDRRKPRSGQPGRLTRRGHTAGELVTAITELTRSRPTAWVYVHNLAFDLTVTRLPLHLAGDGWQVTDLSIGGASPWVKLRRGGKRLVLVDSHSLLPYSLEDIGAQVGPAKPPLPHDSDDDGAWFARCEADVDILERAVGQVMSWWDAHRMGNWAVTGTACGWNAFRHIDAPQRFLIDPDPAGVAADRLTVHGGRRQVWRVGELRAGPYLELDFTAAYPTIASDERVPIGRKQGFESMPVDDWRVDHPRWSIAARCRLSTDAPRWPVRLHRSTWYPVGEFWADLAGPDIAEARRLGCLIEIGPGYVHQLGVALIPWAQWITGVLDGSVADVPPAGRMAAKAWSRSVIGRFAARGHEKLLIGPSPIAGWGYAEGWDHVADARGAWVDMGGVRWWVHAGVEQDNAYPAVLAHIEAQVRVRLGRVIDAIGPGAVVQCDTDGLIVTERTVGTRAARGSLIAPESLSAAERVAWVLEHVQDQVSPLTLRVKRSAAHVHVLGPQHLRTGAQRRLAGIPTVAECPDCADYNATRRKGTNARKCTHMDDGRGLVARAWPKLPWQIGHGDQRGYVLPKRTIHVKGPMLPGWVLRDGRVIPVQTVAKDDGTTEILPWWRTEHRPERATLADVQHRALDGLR